MVTSSVTASDFDVVRVAVFPAEAHVELIVYADAVLSTAVTLERFDTVARRHPKITRRTGRFGVFLFAASEAFHVHQAANSYAVEQSLRVFVGEGLDSIGVSHPGARDTANQYRDSSQHRQYADPADRAAPAGCGIRVVPGPARLTWLLLQGGEGVGYTLIYACIMPML